MGIIDTVRGLVSSEEQVTNLYNCDGCSNIFTKTWTEGQEPDEIACPNCGSTDVSMAVESP